MSTTISQTVSVLEKLDAVSQISVLKFAEFLESSNDEDVAFFDEAKADDDGYRISSNDLRKKYGI